MKLANVFRVAALWFNSARPRYPPLKGALDLRGKTGLREAAAILSNSLVFIGQVGFLMHLARAVDCRSVIVYGGQRNSEYDRVYR